MNMDLKRMPFSCRGSYMAVSELPEGWNGQKNRAGLYLRTVHNSAVSPLIARFRVNGQDSACARVCGAALEMACGDGHVSFCFDDPDTLLIKGTPHTRLTLDFLTGNGPYDYLYSFTRDGRSFVMANCYKNNCRYLLSAEQGTMETDQEWQESSSLYSRAHLSGKEGFLLVLREIEKEWDGTWKAFDFEDSRRKTAESLSDFLSKMPVCPPQFQETAEAAGYLLWASMVHRDGFLKREAMLMSKDWMKHVWSWDHCFNAIALSFHAPETAWDQFMILFDHQDETGRLPDSISDVHIVWNYCKPPVHGWALLHMMRHMALTDAQMQEAYACLEKWTGWWLAYRDDDLDGLYEYSHGNDSGWDNSTVFSVLPPVASPELQAFLVIQMDALSDLAGRLSRKREAEAWKEKADRLLEDLVAGLFPEDLPIAVRGGSHEIIPNQSLLPYVSIVLGERLPERIRKKMVQVLSGDRFRTVHGFATESPQSRAYRSDGYWRGPIWAPSTLLLVDGLNRCGERALARDIAQAFADLAVRSGFAENFDAVTGEGLRDRSYTWTASVFLILAHEYLA